MRSLSPAILALALAVAGCGASRPAPAPLGKDAEVKVGVDLEFSGDTATYGEETWNGIQMALEDLAGKDPWKVTLDKQDNKSDAQESARAVTQLTTVDYVSAIIGAVSSKNTKAGARIANEQGVPMISPGSTAVDATAAGPYISRVCFTDDFQGEVCARFAYEDLGKKTAALVVDKAQDYCVGLGKSFEETYTKLGGKIVGTASYTTKESDFAALIEKVKATNPECIFIPGYYGEVGPMLKQAEQKWAGIPKLGGDGWDSPDLFGLAGTAGALKDCYMSSHFAPDDKDPVIQQFVERYRKKYNNEPGSMAVLGYDAMLVLHDALVRAGTTDPDKIRDAINATKDLKVITGIITMDPNRNPERGKKSAVVLIPEGGKFKFRAKIAGA
jgi:branched-chain amino acid transport system substrate-binding protein